MAVLLSESILARGGHLGGWLGDLRKIKHFGCVKFEVPRIRPLGNV